jgi:hypothetical protein
MRRWSASSLSTGAAQARVFRCPHKGFKSGVERGGHAVGPPLPIHRSRYVLLKTAHTEEIKRAGTPSCIFFSYNSQIKCFRTPFDMEMFLLDYKGFWRWCLTLRITRFLDFVHRTVFSKTYQRTTFRKLDLFPSSGERKHYLWSPRVSERQSLDAASCNGPNGPGVSPLTGGP